MFIATLGFCIYKKEVRFTPSKGCEASTGSPLALTQTSKPSCLHPYYPQYVFSKSHPQFPAVLCPWPLASDPFSKGWFLSCCQKALLSLALSLQISIHFQVLFSLAFLLNQSSLLLSISPQHNILWPSRKPRFVFCCFPRLLPAIVPHWRSQHLVLLLSPTGYPFTPTDPGTRSTCPWLQVIWLPHLKPSLLPTSTLGSLFSSRLHRFPRTHPSINHSAYPLLSFTLDGAFPFLP